MGTMAPTSLARKTVVTSRRRMPPSRVETAARLLRTRENRGNVVRGGEGGDRGSRRDSGACRCRASRNVSRALCSSKAATQKTPPTLKRRGVPENHLRDSFSSPGVCV